MNRLQITYFSSGATNKFVKKEDSHFELTCHFEYALADVRGTKSEVRSPKSEVRSPKSEGLFEDSSRTLQELFERNLFVNIKQRFTRRMLSVLVASLLGLAIFGHTFTATAQSVVTLPMFTQFTSDSFRVHVKALCKNVPMNGLNLSNFTFKENGQILNSVQLVRKANTTASDCFDAALVINRSKDMNIGAPSYIDRVKSASKTFIDNLKPSCDKAALISFANDVSLDAFLSNDKLKLKQQIDSIKTGGSVSMWDAVYLAMIELSYNGSNAARSVILFTNNNDNSSETSSMIDVVTFARQNNISIYIVGGFNASFDSAAVKYAATRTGGKFFYVQDGSDLNNILASVTASIRDEHLQYQFEFKDLKPSLRKRIYEITVTGCDNPLSVKYYLDAGTGINQPADFTLSTSAIRNTDLFRIDRTGCTVPDDFILDTLRLRWQTSTYNEPFLDDTVTYYWNAILDSAGKQITVTILSDNQGKSPSLTIDGLAIYDKLFRRANLTNPDSLVIRIPWFVKAVNTTGGETLSDTAGVSIRNVTQQAPATEPLMLSINRRPNAPSLISPIDSFVLKNVSYNTVLRLNWTKLFDINYSKGFLIGGFLQYDNKSKKWYSNVSNASIDSMFAQARIEVVETFPKGKGAPVGTTINTYGDYYATEIVVGATYIDQIFNQLDNPSTRADSVRIRWTVDVKDFNYTNAKEFVTFDSVWSGVGCRPHLSTSDSRTILLIRGTDPTSIDESKPGAKKMYLSQNYPNPFNTTTTIEVRSARDEGQNNRQSSIVNGQSSISLKVFDLLGREVLDLSEQARSNSTVTISNSQLPKAGVYIYRLQNGNETISRKMILME